MFRYQSFSSVPTRAAIGWFASIAITGGFHDSPTGPGIVRADIIIKDPMRDDQGWTSWEGKYTFTENGMMVSGIVTRDVKPMPKQFDAAVTIDATRSSMWSFGVAGDYSPKSGYSGIGFTADADAEVGVFFARWERGTIADIMRIDADPARMHNDVQRIGISVREDVAFASVNDVIVAKIAYRHKFNGSQIVVASFSDGPTYFRDMIIQSTIPSPASAVIIAAAVAMMASSRHRRR